LFIILLFSLSSYDLVCWPGSFLKEIKVFFLFSFALDFICVQI
jgi:hypothetical protein